jgi:hypothetical protein
LEKGYLFFPEREKKRIGGQLPELCEDKKDSQLFLVDKKMEDREGT